LGLISRNDYNENVFTKMMKTEAEKQKKNIQKTKKKISKKQKNNFHRVLMLYCGLARINCSKKV
jgi:hypothetical protein